MKNGRSFREEKEVFLTARGGSFMYSSFSFYTSFSIVLPHLLNSCFAGFILCFTHLPDDFFCYRMWIQNI